MIWVFAHGYVSLSPLNSFLSARRVIFTDTGHGLPKRIPLIEAVLFKRRADVRFGHLGGGGSRRSYRQPRCHAIPRDDAAAQLIQGPNIGNFV